MRVSGENAVVCLVGTRRAVVVRYAFRTLVVQHTVRMDAEWPIAVVAEHDADGITDDPPNERTEKSQMLPLSRSELERVKPAVGVLAIEHLVIDSAHRSRLRT